MITRDQSLHVLTNFSYTYIFYIIQFSPLQTIQIASGNALFWSALLAIYWLISSSLVANLYVRYCGNDQNVCTREVNRFIILPIMGYLSMLAWVSFNTSATIAAVYNMYVVV